jgi:hypothetical protein
MKVLNLRNYTDIYKTDPNTPIIRVDRLSTNYGNPIVVIEEKDRDWACDCFVEYAIWRIQRQPDWLRELKGKHLACWCAPRRCHADTLLILANLPFEEALKKLNGVSYFTDTK